MRRAVLALLLASSLAPAVAHAYEGQWSLDLAAGWGIAPALNGSPNTGPLLVVSPTFGVADTWAIRPYVGYAVHPPFNGGDAFHVFFGGVEGLYLLDVLAVVPSFGVGIDVLPTYDGRRVDAAIALHAVVSIDWLASRQFILGLDARPYFLLNALSFNPIYVAITLRASVLFDY